MRSGDKAKYMWTPDLHTHPYVVLTTTLEAHNEQMILQELTSMESFHCTEGSFHYKKIRYGAKKKSGSFKNNVMKSSLRNHQ